MNAGSGPTSRRQLAEWTHDPGCACSSVSPGCSLLTADTLFPVSFTDWPRSAMWDATGLYELPTPEPAIAGSDGSALLPTPMSHLATNGGSQHPSKRRSGGHTPTLADEIEHLLPTPDASMAGGGRVSKEYGGRRPSGSKKSITLTDAIAHKLPGGRTAPQSPGGLPSLDDQLQLPLS